ncbi:MAG: glycosyltransferase family 2 protein [Actinobacteria bacterium]|nr:glycosyltransferase family 2 protein [Actinomycetota bacterium]
MTVIRTRVSAVVLAYRTEPWLERSVRALLASEEVDVDVVLVDNGGTDGAVERLGTLPGVRVVGDGENLGFSGGCNLGASVATGEYLALVNGDLVVEPDALARLCAVAAEPDVGIAAGSVRLGDDPSLLNTAGNEIHFLGFSWVGGFGEPAATAAIDRDVAGGMGALVAMRREVWDALGGFAEQYFAFHEDAELSWRCWQRGLRVHYVPDAVGLHRYDFDREPRKMYLAERNRLVFVVTCWDDRTLAVLAPVFVAVELAVAVAAAKDGRFGDKLAGWRWLWSHRRWLRERRALVQGTRTVGDRALARLLTDRLDARNFSIPEAMRPLDALLAWYWRIARRFLR